MQPLSRVKLVLSRAHLERATFLEQLLADAELQGSMCMNDDVDVRLGKIACEPNAVCSQAPHHLPSKAGLSIYSRAVDRFWLAISFLTTRTMSRMGKGRHIRKHLHGRRDVNDQGLDDGEPK